MQKGAIWDLLFKAIVRFSLLKKKLSCNHTNTERRLGCFVVVSAAALRLPMLAALK